MITLRYLAWLYLLLLLFEGALRKWIVPSLDTPLLIVRDPVAILIYIVAAQNGLRFANGFFIANLVLAFLTGLVALVATEGNIFTTIFGLRTDFLHVPLIFLLPQIFNRSDVIKIGYFLLILSLFMAALVIMQFRAPPDSWLNTGAMKTHYGTVRPSATFSFMTGTVAFFALASSFIFYGFIYMRTYKIWILAPAVLALLAACACSGSRSCIVSVGLVAAAAVLSVLFHGRGGVGIIVAGALIFIAFELLQSTDVFQSGSEQLVRRFEDAGAYEGNAEGFVGRFGGEFLVAFDIMGETPLFGHGLGVGTNAAAGMLRGQREFIGPEGEWGRLVFECGAIFGFLLIVFRTALTIALAARAFQALRRDNVLPILLLASSGLLVLNGQWGVPTTLGFAVFGAGLMLAACEDDEEEDLESEEYGD